MRVLVVEDEAKTAGYIRKGLSEHGFAVAVTTDGVEGLHLAVAGAYDAIVLDVILPGLTGWQVVERLRDTGNRTPVLLLTARDAVEDRVRGLDLGADDYLVKPFAFSELLARVRALLRRRTDHELQELAVADLTLNVVTRRAFRGAAHRPYSEGIRAPVVIYASSGGGAVEDHHCRKDMGHELRQ